MIFGLNNNSKINISEDIELSSLFECQICCNETDIVPTKYKCTVCKEKICDSCYLEYISKKNKNCMFCREKLELNEDFEIDIDYNRLSVEMYRLHKYKIRIFLIIIFIWYVFLIVYLFKMSKK